tara:strand:+ start:513 stop:1916 length:1404 start_codon:yes stop_codon:yes gene_type:complete
MEKKLVNSLENLISGHVTDRKEFLDFYSLDSSSYSKRPKLIVFPNSIDDIKKTIRFAKKRKIPICARGGSTGLVGSSLTTGIILDMKNFNKIKLSKNHVTVGAGVSKGELDSFLTNNKKFLGTNPSVGAFCKIGGMIANNSSGSRSLKYGSVVDNLLEVVLVDGSGNEIVLPKNKPVSKKIAKISNGTNQLFPHVTKNSSGYRLDVATEKNSQKIIAGSESTLGIIIQAKLRVFDIPKKRQLTVVGFKKSEDALYVVPYILRLNPSSLEFVDETIIQNIPHKFKKETKCLLMIEFDSNVSESQKNLNSLIHEFSIVFTSGKKSDIEKWWSYRDSALFFTLKHIPKNLLVPHVIEDATVPPENLKYLVTLLKKITKKYRLKFVVYGHAGNGNLHIRLISNSKRNLDKLHKEFFSFVVSLDGTISGEHGDGIARTKYLKLQYSPYLLQKFQQIKKQFDPSGILNPGNII